MKITELQNIKVLRVQDAQVVEEIIIIMEEGELRFYEEVEIEYSYFLKQKEKS